MSRTYTGVDPYFGLIYPMAGEKGDSLDEAEKTLVLGRLFQVFFDALGAGVVSGGVASIDGTAVDLSACEAVIADAIGALPVTVAADSLAVGEFEEGDNWVFLQLGTAARADGSAVYLVDQSDEEPARAIVIAKVVVTSGAIASVDNTVKDVPAIAARIPWEVLQRSYEDATSLLAFLTAVLGDRYMDGTAPGTVDARLTAGETGGGGEGGGTVYWGDLGLSSGDPTTILDKIRAEIADAGIGGGSIDGTAVSFEEWDEDARRGMDLVIAMTHYFPDLPDRLTDCLVFVPGIAGDGSDGKALVYDVVHSSPLE